MERLSIACDFDGTITCNDTLHLIVEAFGAPGVWAAIEPRLLGGEISLEQAMSEQFSQVRATPQQVHDLVLARAGLRPGFREFVAWVDACGHRLVVLSSGFRGVIDGLLQHWGFPDLEVTSHEAHFGLGGCELVWSDRGEACGHCGRRCKRHDIDRLGLTRPLVYLGDGVSDRCAAEAADLIFARSDLADHLDRRQVAYVPFQDFHQVRRRLEQPVRLAA